MRGYRVLYLQKPADKKSKDFIDGTVKYLTKNGHDVNQCTGYRNLSDVRNYDALILNDIMEAEGATQKPAEIIKELDKLGITLPIVRFCEDSEQAQQLTQEYQIANKNIVAMGKNDSQHRRNLGRLLRSKLGMLLDIGISGQGNLGSAFLGQLREQPYVNSINVHSEHYKADYSRLWIPSKVERAGLAKRGFQSLEEMLEENPNIDLLYVMAGKHGEAAPAAGIQTRDRSAGFVDTMNVIYPRLLEIKKAIEDRRFNGLVILESGPQDIILEYMIKRMEFPPNKVTGVSPDAFRARLTLRDRIREILINQIRTGHGKEGLEYDSTKLSLEDNFKDIADSLSDNDKSIMDYLRGLNVEDVSLDVIGGRSWPIPLFSSCTVKSEKLFDLRPELAKKEEQDRLIEKIKQYAWKMMEIVSKEGRTYVDSADECIKFAQELSRGKEQPGTYAYCWRKDYDMCQISPNEIVFGEGDGVLIQFDESRKPKLSQYERDRMNEGVEMQKKANQERIAEFKAQGRAA